MSHRLQQENTQQAHMIVTSQHKMDGLTSLFWESFKKDISKASGMDDTHYGFYLWNDHDAETAAPIPTLEIPANSHTTSPNSSPPKSSAALKPVTSLVFRLQKLNGMEKKRRSCARRKPAITTRPNQFHQKSEVPRTGEASTPWPLAESPARSGQQKNGCMIDEVVGSVYDAHSQSISSENTTFYSSTTSPVRSPSTCSPTYPDMAFSPLTGFRWLPLEHSSPHSGSLAISQGAYSSIQRSPVSSPDPPLLASSVYQGLPNYQPVGPIRSHYPNGRHVNQRRPHLQTHYSDAGSWQRPQRGPSNADYSSQHTQLSFAPAPDTPQTQQADAPLSPYLSHGQNYAEVAADHTAAFYSDYNHNMQFYAPHNYKGPHVEPTPYMYSMHSSSSLHPSPISFVP